MQTNAQQMLQMDAKSWNTEQNGQWISDRTMMGTMGTGLASLILEKK